MALTLAEQLVEAQTAYHDLMTGSSVVEVRDSSGESVRFTIANASRLRDYITNLKSQIAAVDAGTTVTRYPMRLQF